MSCMGKSRSGQKHEKESQGFSSSPSLRFAPLISWTGGGSCSRRRVVCTDPLPSRRVLLRRPWAAILRQISPFGPIAETNSLMQKQTVVRPAAATDEPTGIAVFVGFRACDRQSTPPDRPAALKSAIVMAFSPFASDSRMSSAISAAGTPSALDLFSFAADDEAAVKGVAGAGHSPADAPVPPQCRIRSR